MERDDLDLATLSQRVEADEYHTLGQARFREGDVEDAAAYYQMSLDLFPTAETYTSLGVALAARGEWEAAIAYCERAIAIDPELGNPYNDIGVYLGELSRHEEAFPYFDKALLAPRYDCRHYPPYHRGRLLEELARFGEARDALLLSLSIEPQWEPAQIALHRVLGWLN